MNRSLLAGTARHDRRARYGRSIARSLANRPDSPPEPKDRGAAWTEERARPFDPFLTARLPFSQIECVLCNPVMPVFAPGCASRAPALRPRSPRGTPAHSASRLRRARWAKAQPRSVPEHRKARYYAAITAATVIGAGLAVGATVAGANAAPRTAGSAAPDQPGGQLDRPARRDRDADQAPGRDLPGERVVRPLLRDLSVRGQHRRDHLPRQARHPDGERPVQPITRRPDRPLLTNNPNTGNDGSSTPRASRTHRRSPATRTTATPRSRRP